MENRGARVVEDDKKYYLELEMSGENQKLPLNDDDVITIKKIYNRLILDLKKGEFKYTIEDVKDNLYYQISEEYIKQLNNELSLIYTDLKNNNMLD